MIKLNGNIGQGRDTRMCGDPKSWFPMRVTYQREMKVKAELDRLGIENFVPMRYKVVESQNEGDTELRRVLVPAINNLIFVRSTQEQLSELKQTNEVLEPLRYMMDRTASLEHAIMTVADREMENFMRVASRTDDSVMYLDDDTIVGKEGKRVEIMGGAFEGVTNPSRLGIAKASSALRSLFVHFSGAEKRNQRDIYPQGPLHRGMQTKSRRNRRLSVGFGNAGHALSLL